MTTEEKLNKAIEALKFYAEIQDANDELTLEDSERLYMKDYDDFEYVNWTHKDLPGKSYKVKTLGRLARQTLKEIEVNK